MSSKSVFALDTNSLLDNIGLIEHLVNQEDTQVVIPYHVLLELDTLKKKAHLKDRIQEIVTQLEDNFDKIDFSRCENTSDSLLYKTCVDHTIIQEAKKENITLVTNDRIMGLLAKITGLRVSKSEVLQDAESSAAEKQTGFKDYADNTVANTFKWESGLPVFYGNNNERKPISYQNDVWKVEPKSVYQNLAFDLLLNDSLDLVSIQSPAGYGKTMCALAAAFYLTLEKKKYDKIYVVKSTQEVDESLGFLPGDIEDKIKPYFSYLDSIIFKLHELRPANRIFADQKVPANGYDKRKFDTVPLQFLRGQNIENAFVIIDEAQNISRNGMRTVLTRMGNNVKCVVLGDVQQVDNEKLNTHDNGLNWVVKKCLGAPNYAHFVLRGTKSRGPITDLILKARL